MNVKKLLNYTQVFFNFTAVKQLINPKEIPFIILNFNQLETLKELVNFAISKSFRKIVIIDNASTYMPLLEYYNEIKDKVAVEHMAENYGPTVFMERDEIYNKYAKGFFILTDSDITPNEKLPKNFLRVLLKHLLLKYNKVTKVGFALDIETIPNYYPAKDKVLKWESQFWKSKIEDHVYYANIDTTFALYKPNPKKRFKKRTDHLWALRIAGNFTSKHGGWYIDYNNLSEEQEFYLKTTSKSSSWVIKDGKTNQEDYNLQ